MALKVSTHWTVATLLVRDAVRLGSRGVVGEEGWTDRLGLGE